MDEINQKKAELLELDKSINPQELDNKINQYLQEQGMSRVLEYLNQRIEIKKNPPDMRSTTT